MLQRGLLGRFILAVFPSVMLALVPTVTSGQTASFGYACESCPVNWANLDPEFAECGQGSAQSPIVIGTRKTASDNLPGLSVQFEPTNFEVERLATNFEAFAEGGGLTLGGVRYELIQFHFHSLSEHFVNGEQFPLEAHFVHQAANGDLAVLAVFIREGGDNGALDPLLDLLPEIAAAEESASIPLDNFDPTVLLPNGRRTVRYIGSTTTPPCQEGVQWLLLRQPVKLSAMQIATIQETIREINEGFDNNRPIQSLNQRELQTESVQDDDD